MTTTTTTNPFPDIPLPAGAEVADAWEDWNNQFRIFHAADRVVLGADGQKLLEVCTVGFQLPDGSVDTGENPPGVHIYTYSDDDLTTDQARTLAAMILEAAEQADGWVKK